MVLLPISSQPPLTSSTEVTEVARCPTSPRYLGGVSRYYDAADHLGWRTLASFFLMNPLTPYICEDHFRNVPFDGGCVRCSTPLRSDLARARVLQRHHSCSGARRSPRRSTDSSVDDPSRSPPPSAQNRPRRARVPAESVEVHPRVAIRRRPSELQRPHRNGRERR